MEQTTLTIPSEVRAFLESLLKDANIQTPDEEAREEIIKELYARLDNFMTSTIIDNMPAEHLDEFIKMNEEKRPKEEIERFLKDKMPNSQDVFAKAFLEFKDLYLGNTAVARNTPQEPEKPV